MQIPVYIREQRKPNYCYILHDGPVSFGVYKVDKLNDTDFLILGLPSRFASTKKTYKFKASAKYDLLKLRLFIKTKMWFNSVQNSATRFMWTVSRNLDKKINQIYNGQ